MEYLSHSPEETEHIGEMLGRRLRPGTVVAYRGGLGMGKTAFTRGLARGLGCAGRVTSPTFTIVNEYDGATPLFHFDMYRLGSSDELFDIGWEDYLTRGGVCAVEWSERVDDAMPADTLWWTSPGARARATASSPSREASDSENTGIGDLRQERVRGRDGKRHTAGPGVSGPGLTHSVTLMPLLDGMLKTAGLTLDDMDIIAVAQGPGSFTGIRIGVSAAKGLAWAKALPCCGVSTLEAMAYGVTDFEGVVVGAMDARRQQVYNALFRTENGRVTRLCADRAVAMELVAEELAAMPEPKLIVGDGAVLLYDFLQKAGIGCRLASPLHRQQSAAGVALAAEHLAAQGLTCSAQELQPVYLRLSQAERERLARGLSLTAE